MKDGPWEQRGDERSYSQDDNNILFTSEHYFLQRRNNIFLSCKEYSLTILVYHNHRGQHYFHLLCRRKETINTSVKMQNKASRIQNRNSVHWEQRGREGFLLR